MGIGLTLMRQKVVDGWQTLGSRGGELGSYFGWRLHLLGGAETAEVDL